MRGTRLLALLSLRGLTDDSGHECCQRLAGVAPHLDPQHFSRVGLLVEELDDSLQFRRNLVSHEHHPDPPRLQIGLQLTPESIHVAVLPYQLLDPLLWVKPVAFALHFEAGPQLLDRPVGDAVGRIVQHLPHNLSTDTAIAAPLDFNQGGNRILIHKQMIQGPAATTALVVRNTQLATNQKPTTRRRSVDLVSGKEIGIVGQESLEQVLRVVGLFGHRHKVLLTIEQEDTTGHIGTPSHTVALHWVSQPSPPGSDSSAEPDTAEGS